MSNTTMIEKAEREFEVKNSRRLRNEAKAWNRYCDRADAAESQIGEITREGKTVFYVWPAGGRYREGHYSDLIEFLIRNNYA